MIHLIDYATETKNADSASKAESLNNKCHLMNKSEDGIVEVSGRGREGEKGDPTPPFLLPPLHDSSPTSSPINLCGRIEAYFSIDSIPNRRHKNFKYTPRKLKRSRLTNSTIAKSRNSLKSEAPCRAADDAFASKHDYNSQHQE